MTALNWLLTASEPGDALHHLHAVAAPEDGIGPLGVADENKLRPSVYVIAADRDAEPVERFLRKTFIAAGIEHTRKGEVILFAALSQEGGVVDPVDGLSRRLLTTGRLQEHPDVAEVTMVYAAARDGRRWRGRRWLTGPKAGVTEDVRLLVGRPVRFEGSGITGADLIRRLVGM